MRKSGTRQIAKESEAKPAENMTAPIAREMPNIAKENANMIKNTTPRTGRKRLPGQTSGIKTYPEKVAAKSKAQYARRKGNGGFYSAKEWLELKSKYGRCLGRGCSELDR